MSEPAVQSTVDFVVGNETFKTSYTVWGDLKTSIQTPLVFLHGGPGIPSPYLAPFSSLLTSHSIPVVTYDQIGCGQSSPVTEKPASFFSMELFMDELDNLLSHLGISGNFSLYGHSWGGLLGSYYAGTREPKGLKKLVLASSLAKTEDMVAHNEFLLSTCDQDVQDAINGFELDCKDVMLTQEYQDAIHRITSTKEEPREGDEKYKEVIDKFMKFRQNLPKFQAQYACRLPQFPMPLIQSFMAMGPYPNAGNKCFGPFYLRTGPWMLNKSSIPVLPRITAPTLVYHGKYDQAGEPVAQPFLKGIPNVKHVVFEESAHVPHLEEQEKCFKIVGDFLVA